VNDIVTIVASA